ncbi:MAG: efflux RND transporter permease subunit [Rickettsiales bacterium]|jgi:HAE1 family hydrophobic/amphiphilic exporter-1|nr:efflux RND transporter permease subunit [Rickettsiales bacterium]
MIKFFVHRPITTLMFVLFWVVLGIVSYPKMNVERMPPMDLPMVTTTLLYPGAGPAEIESQVVKPVEDVISKVSGIKKITSQVYDNYAYIITEFNLEEDGMEKQQEIKGQVDSIVYDLPDQLEQPVVRKLNILQQTVMDLAISGVDLRDAYDFVDDVLSQRITSIKGVASVDIFGGRERAIRVFLDPQRMTAKGVSINAVLQAINAYNLNVPSGKIETRFSSNAIRFIGEFATVKAIEEMQITTAEGLAFPLKEIATVEDSAKDVATGGRYNGEEVLIISIVKATDGNAVKISDSLINRLDGYRNLLRRELKSENADIRIINDAATSIRNDTEDTLEGIIFGLILTVIVLLVFTRNWRSTIIASVVIPASLVSGFLFMGSSGFSINSMTLLAMASALGTLISNAIILIESAITMIDDGATPEHAAIEGTKRVAVAVLAGVGTNIVVFLPLAFMEGIAGLFMNQFGMTVVYLTLMSLLFSFTLTPMMIAKFLKKTERKKVAENIKHEKHQLDWFKKIFDSEMAHPWRWLGIAVATLFLSASLLSFVGNEFSPTTDIDEINITARAPMGSTFEKAQKLALKVEEKLANFPEVAATSVKIGRRGLQNVLINVKLVPLSERESDKAIAQRMVAAFADIPDAEFSVKAGESQGGGFSTSDMVINVLGDDDEAREKLADELMAKINAMDEVQSAMLAAQVPNDEIQFIPNQNKMSEWGAANASVGMALRTAFYGDDTLRYREKGEEYPLIVEFSKTYKTVDSFNEVLIDTRRGMVPISELGKLEYRQASRNVYRIDKHRLTEIDVNLGKSTIGPVRSKIQTEINKMNVPDGLRITFGGMSETQDETTGEMANTFLLATILTFMLLAAILNSVAHPFTIATSIITSFAGVFVFLFLTGGTVNIAAMLSIIMLVGLVVNNNILLLEPTVNEVSAGTAPAKALWNQFNDKYRMILMTTIAVVAGMLPQLFSPDGTKISMAAVLVGGMLGGLLWTFALTPALFVLMEKLRRKILKKN